MKKEFIGFYSPTKQEIDEAWTNGKIVFDANALLNLYRYSKSTREDLLSVINKLKDKLFMPYQVGLEFHTNRHRIIEGMNESYLSLSKQLEEIISSKTLEILNQYKRHPSIEIAPIKKY